MNPGGTWTHNLEVDPLGHWVRGFWSFSTYKDLLIPTTFNEILLPIVHHVIFTYLSDLHIIMSGFCTDYLRFEKQH